MFSESCIVRNSQSQPCLHIQICIECTVFPELKKFTELHRCVGSICFLNMSSVIKTNASALREKNDRDFFFFLTFFLLKFLHTTYKTNTGTLFYNSLQFLTLNYDTNTNATLLTKKTATLLILNNKLHKKRKTFYLRSKIQKTESTKLGLLNYH